MELRLKEEVIDKLLQIIECADVIQERSSRYHTEEDYLCSPTGMTVLDSCIMRLQVVGEAVRVIDDMTDKTLLVNYPQIIWKNVIGLRNIISHQYANIDYTLIVDAINTDILPIKETCELIIRDLTSQP